jgi:hypothetical protein
MIEIQLPCCDSPATLEPAAVEVRCEACAIVLELAPDARETASPDRANRTDRAVPIAA